MKEIHISPMNTRAFKKEKNHFIISVGSIDEEKTRHNVKSKNGNNVFDVEYGEFGPYLAEANKYLK